MKLKDILRPWSALREARIMAEAMARSRGQAMLQLDDFRGRMKLHSDAQAETIRRLRELARKGAYHDPKTGRMMKRGVIPAEYQTLVNGQANEPNPQFGLAQARSYQQQIEQAHMNNRAGDKS